MSLSSPTYGMEYWEFDFLAKHLLNNEEVSYYAEDGDYAEIVASTERNNSTVVFHAKRDSQSTWFNVFSLNEGEELGTAYLETMTDPRVDSVQEESRKTYGIE